MFQSDQNGQCIRDSDILRADKKVRHAAFHRRLESHLTNYEHKAKFPWRWPDVFVEPEVIATPVVEAESLYAVKIFSIGRGIGTAHKNTQHLDVGSMLVLSTDIGNLAPYQVAQVTSKLHIISLGGVLTLACIC
jgi:hypothetical protein